MKEQGLLCLHGYSFGGSAKQQEGQGLAGALTGDNEPSREGTCRQKHPA